MKKNEGIKRKSNLEEVLAEEEEEATEDEGSPDTDAEATGGNCGRNQQETPAQVYLSNPNCSMNVMNFWRVTLPESRDCKFRLHQNV
jgi:hypothetical protein